MPARRDPPRLLALLVAIWAAAAPWARGAEGTEPQTARPLVGQMTDAEVVASIDRLMRQSWREAGVTPATKAPDGAWARRLYLDLLGRIPTVAELDAYQAVAPGERRAWLIDTLLQGSGEGDHADWLATEWANLLIGRTGGMGGGSLADRDGLLTYLREAFTENRPYDRFVGELITATGGVSPEDDNFNGAANFLADKLREDGVQATAKTSQLFLGVAVQCTQCHDHPFNEAGQNEFWELNAFFRQARVERVRGENRRPYARVVDRDFYGEGRGPRAVARLAPGEPERAETYYELRNGRMKVAYPVFLDGTSLADLYAERGFDFGDSGRLEKVNRRAELADLVTGSPRLARAAVNREWARFFGHGFTRPTGDMGPHNPPSHPELLEALAEAFRDSGHDLRRLERWIVSSEAYALDSRSRRSNEQDDPSLGGAPLFSRFYLRQLTAEQIFGSLMTATQADEAVPDDRREQARRNWLRRFNTAFGDDENNESTSFDGSIPQTLAMMNSPLVRRATSLPRGANGARPGDREQANFLTEVVADPLLDDQKKVRRLYLAALARAPSRPELRACNRLLAARGGNTGEALRDIWWALLNTNEFILQH